MVYKFEFVPNDFIRIDNISKGERTIQVKGTSKRKAHKRVIITRDLDRLGNKTKISKGIISTDYKESVKNMNNYITNLNQTDKGKEILKSIFDYTLSNYSGINNYMKNPQNFKDLPKDVLENLKDNVSNIEKFINDAPKFKGKVYRGLQYHTNDPESKKRWENFIKSVENSKEMKFGSFTSTSESKIVGVNFATKQHFGTNMKSILIEINTKSGISIQNISQVESEHEILLNNDKTYKIISFEKQDERNHFLNLEEI